MLPIEFRNLISYNTRQQQPECLNEFVRIYWNVGDEKAIKPAFKATYINNRRYLGNKYKLLPFITSVVEHECVGIESVADIFAGTGAVASAFIDKKLITNDNLYSNYICHIAWFSSQEYSREKIEKFIAYYNNKDVDTENYMSRTFGDTFFSYEDCCKIGFIRDDIESQFKSGEINGRERALLITSLLYAADKIANTCGHYDAYRKGIKFDKHLELSVPLPADGLNYENICYNTDANELISRIQADLVYIDPPYNSRQYCDAYHLLENIARWEKPKVFGVAKKMDRMNMKSDYCTSKATAVFEDLITKVNAQYILLSYSNMAQKGNERSNAKISDENIMRILSTKGEVKIFKQSYKPFSAGKSDIDEHEERLFLCICKQPKKREFIQSPLNYTGGKYKLLGQILPHFPKRIDTFVDLFCGGCNVGINVNADKVIFNDINSHLLYLYKMFENSNKDNIVRTIDDVIDKYSLSRSTINGYEFYNCESSIGLGDYNRKHFLKLRTDFNTQNEEYIKYIMLYVLIVYAFNNQIRFNSKGEFNLPIGKRDFNENMKSKLCTFINRLQGGNYNFVCNDFRKFDFSNLTSNSLVYCDPPYLFTCATYNEQGGWNEQCEKDLLAFLDNLDKHKIKFALSNVLRSKGKNNEMLEAWAAKYHIIHLDCKYSNSNYQRKDRSGNEDEVLIINYKEYING
jgi:adenine-specific DNA-methyltransferase